jgi:hypothetical protein
MAELGIEHPTTVSRYLRRAFRLSINRRASFHRRVLWFHQSYSLWKAHSFSDIYTATVHTYIRTVLAKISHFGIPIGVLILNKPKSRQCRISSEFRPAHISGKASETCA